MQLKYYNEKYKIVIGVSPRAGNGTTGDFLRQLGEVPVREGLVHDRRDLVEDPEWLSIKMVRDPYEKIISGYMWGVAHGTEFASNRNLTFREFLEQITGSNGRVGDIDPHFGLQNCDLKYKYVCKTENNYEDVSEIIKKYRGITLNPVPRFRYTDKYDPGKKVFDIPFSELRVDGKIPIYEAFYDDEGVIRNKVTELFKEDIDLYKSIKPIKEIFAKEDSNKCWNLMDNNIPQEDLNELAEFIKGNPKLTNGERVIEFEKKWSEWAQVKHSVYVNSGGNANLISLIVLREKLLEQGADIHNLGEVIVSSVNWVTDITSVMLCGFKPIFVDVDLSNVSMGIKNIFDAVKIPDTKAIMLTHLMGFNALTDDLLEKCKDWGIMLIEDCCESHGATHNGKRIGSFGDMSNYSFYYGHHISTIEGGMICTNDDYIYQMVRMVRSHGLVRECTDDTLRKKYFDMNPEPAPEFVFAYTGFNFRGTEIGAFLGIKQMTYIDNNIQIRRKNFELFVSLLDKDRFFTNFKMEGNSNFGLIIILKDKDDDRVVRICDALKKQGVAFRRGIAGGGNQLRQPYLKRYNYGKPEDFPNAEHIHYYGLYIGNHQYITEEQIRSIVELLNNA